MEKNVCMLLAVSLCLSLVCTAVVPPTMPPMCLMDCLSEWFPCEYDCRKEFAHIPSELRSCALECEEDRAICMKESIDPACNNNRANNQRHLQFKTTI
ncbi:gigasin-4-like [Saccostrea echinata]|uniref:gigasin-4-like n=1 Tax=Saccostrea echinata TaxID=191078 RepID=UPI002A7FD958|nr:gigasin-4-like [Saccostrea echinata]